MIKREISLLAVAFFVAVLWAPVPAIAAEMVVDGVVPATPKKKITLKVQNADLSTLLRSLAAETGRNIVITGKITGTVTVDLRDVNVDDAISAILRTSGLGAEYQRDLIIVRPIGETQSAKVFRLKYINGASISAQLKEFLSEGGKLSYDADSNSIMVQDATDNIGHVALMISEIDRLPRQVLVEAAIVDVKLEDDMDSAMNAVFQDTHWKAGTQGLAAVTNSGLLVRVTEFGITGVIDMLRTKTKTNVLAHPKILALNDKEAEILIGERIPYKTKTFDNANQTTENVDFIETGTRLKFTPHITESGEILMAIHPEVSSAGTQRQTDLPPDESTTEATTHIRVLDGQTIVLGGLIRNTYTDTDTQIPILGDIPLLGLLFKKKNRDTEKREILIIITPNIINSEDTAAIHAEIDRHKNMYNTNENETFTGFKKKKLPPHKNPEGVMHGFGDKII